MNTLNSIFTIGAKLKLALCGVLTVLLFCPGLISAAEVTGTVSSVNGKTVVIDMAPGQLSPGIGDRVEISFKVGEKKFMVGDWQVIRVSGRTVYAEETAAKLPVDTGMQATVFTGAARRAAGNQQTTTASQPARNSELFWRDQGAANAPPAQTAQTADPTDELFWLQPGYRPGQAPITATQPPVRASAAAQPRTQPAPARAAHTVAAQPGAIQTISASDYDMIWNDSGSGAMVDFATFRPVGPAGYYPLGDVAQSGPWSGARYGAPTFTTLMVKDGTVPLAQPVDYRLTWSSRGSDSNLPFSTWEPIPPAGYQCLGDVGSNSLDGKPSLDAVRCVPESCVVQTGLGRKIWDDSGSGAVRDFSAWSVPETNTYIGVAAHARPRNTVYTLSQSCL
jgi:hypothetical protein